jgi:hypothetical protein
MRTLRNTAAGLCLTPLLGLGLALGGELKESPGKGPQAKPPAKAESETRGSFNTSVEFYDTPSEAARHAKKEEKLVFVLHVSGNFEDPRFT